MKVTALRNITIRSKDGEHKSYAKGDVFAADEKIGAIANCLARGYLGNENGQTLSEAERAKVKAGATKPKRAPRKPPKDD